MESNLATSPQKRSRIGVPSALMEASCNSSSANEPSILEMVTGPEFSTVGKPAASGTCRSVHQTLLESEMDLKAAPPRAMICLQSARGEATPTYKQPARFITLAEVRASLEANGKKVWEDPDFPAADSSLFCAKERPDYLPSSSLIQWKRPTELVKDPELVTDGVTKFDVHQGHLGDCWFLAPLAALTTNPALYDRVMDGNQTFDAKAGYCGAFAFKFFVGGEWREVVVDDRLPTLKGKLLFLKSGDEKEFWPCLLEKAFAKLNGCYDGLSGGDFTEASSYFGAISESFNIRGPYFGGLDPKYVKERVLEAHKLGSLCGAAIFDLGPINSDSRSKYGLPSGHAYSLTGSEEDKVEVRNPWGEKTEWVGQTSAPDGEFWIEWNHFFTHFHQVQVAHYSLDSAMWQSPAQGHKWVGVEQAGSWTKETAGGCPNYRSFAMNPQYQVSVGKAGGEPILLLISLDQIASHRLAMGMEKYPIGFTIFKSQTDKRLSAKELGSQPWIGDSGVYRYDKQVVGRYKVAAGTTLTIIPSTYYPKATGEFFLRVWHYEEEKDAVSLTLLPPAHPSSS